MSEFDPTSAALDSRGSCMQLYKGLQSQQARQLKAIAFASGAGNQ